jgi:uridine kinase
MANTFMAMMPQNNPPTNRPLCIGVVGDSGSGKSTLIRGLHRMLGSEHITEICLDDYHRYDRQQRELLDITALNPNANNLLLMAKHLLMVKNGRPILKPVYNHATGQFDTPELLFPKEIVLVHGLFTLYSPQFARLFDLTIYLDPEEELRRTWKIRRDTGRRGYTLPEVLRHIEERKRDAALYVEPQKANADVVISFRHGSSANELDLWIDWRKGAHLLSGQITPFARVTQTATGCTLQIEGKIDLTNACILAEKLGVSIPELKTQLSGVLGYFQDNNTEQHSLTLALAQLISLVTLTTRTLSPSKVA